LCEWFVSLDVGEADQDDPFAAAALHLDTLRGHFGQQVPALAAALLGEDHPITEAEHDVAFQ
jgi:hypothetical protein